MLERMSANMSQRMSEDMFSKNASTCEVHGQSAGKKVYGAQVLFADLGSGIVG